MAPVECPQCGTKYVIHLPEASYVIMILDKGDLLIRQASAMIVGGVGVGSLYWTCATFGAVTLMQTLGQEKCLNVMEQTGVLYHHFLRILNDNVVNSNAIGYI